jgi:hypothetical protein
MSLPLLFILTSKQCAKPRLVVHTCREPPFHVRVSLSGQLLLGYLLNTTLLLLILNLLTNPLCRIPCGSNL